MIRVKSHTNIVYCISKDVLSDFYISCSNYIFFLTVYHCQLLECLMKYKQEVWKVSFDPHLTHSNKLNLYCIVKIVFMLKVFLGQIY